MAMTYKPSFPTSLHQNAANLVKDFFMAIPDVDTVLVVNSCAREQAVPESDLDFAILVNPETSPIDILNMEKSWQKYQETQTTILKYKRSSPFSHLHLDIIDGNYTSTKLEVGVATDFFEIEIGNQIC